jgi:hypothetical protein
MGALVASLPPPAPVGDVLPDALLVLVLAAAGDARASQTCARWHRLCHDAAHWRQVFRAEFAVDVLDAAAGAASGFARMPNWLHVLCASRVLRSAWSPTLGFSRRPGVMPLGGVSRLVVKRTYPIMDDNPVCAVVFNVLSQRTAPRATFFFLFGRVGQSNVALGAWCAARLMCATPGVQIDLVVACQSQCGEARVIVDKFLPAGSWIAQMQTSSINGHRIGLRNGAVVNVFAREHWMDEATTAARPNVQILVDCASRNDYARGAGRLLDRWTESHRGTLVHITGTAYSNDLEEVAVDLDLDRKCRVPAVYEGAYYGIGSRMAVYEEFDLDRVGTAAAVPTPNKRDAATNFDQNSKRARQKQ